MSDRLLEAYSCANDCAEKTCGFGRRHNSPAVFFPSPLVSSGGRKRGCRAEGIAMSFATPISKAVTVVLGLAVLGLAAAAAQSPEDVKLRFERLAADLQVFQTGEMLYGRGDLKHERFIPKKVVEPWRKVYAEIARDHDIDHVAALLKHNDPKVRTLALGALFESQNPKALPHLAGLVADKEKTVPDVRIRRAGPIFFGGNIKNVPEAEDLIPDDFHQQTVGAVAKAFLDFWLSPSGYSAKDFDAYWAKRKDRNHCADWYVVRMLRAGQGSSNFDSSRIPLIQAIRKEIDALPAMERDWTLLWVAAHHTRSLSEEPLAAFVKPAEIVDAAKRLGPERLMDLIGEKEISPDPDLAPRSSLAQRRSRGRDDMILLVLKNAKAVLRPQDAAVLLETESKQFERSPWFALAAAELQPEKAGEWLRSGMRRFPNEATYDAWPRAELAAGLWRIVGPSETDFLVDWFYRERVDPYPHTTQTEIFLRNVKGVRAPADRKLLERLVLDARLDKLDHQSLRGLIDVVNGWTKAPVVPRSDLHRVWSRGKEPQTADELRVFEQWRTSLRASVDEWKAR
jgi:hypothetical protein